MSRWWFEPLFPLPFVAIASMIAAILYVMLTGLLAGPERASGSTDAGLAFLATAGIVVVALLLFSIATRRPPKKRQG